MTRGLKNRHLQMIALGGAIGTGLFYGSASTIALAGPSVMLAYLLGGIIIFFIIGSEFFINYSIKRNESLKGGKK